MMRRMANFMGLGARFIQRSLLSTQVQLVSLRVRLVDQILSNTLTLASNKWHTFYALIRVIDFDHFVQLNHTVTVSAYITP